MKTYIFRKQTREHFTLLELFIIFVIILILALILLPRLARSKEYARDALCLSNVKQLATGVECYLLDSDMYLAQTTYFLTDFTPYHIYIKSFGVYDCPSSTTSLVASTSDLVQNTDYMLSGTMEDIERNSNYNNGRGNNPYHFDPSNPR